MAALKLKKWPFEQGEVVELYWFGPVKLRDDRWHVVVAFKSQNKDVVLVEYPWGTLPKFRIGQIYVDGVLQRTAAQEGIINMATFQSFNMGSFCQGFDMPPALRYFHKKPQLGTQHLYKITTGSTNYYIPCIELIRFLFVKNRSLAYQLLQPNGLNLIFDRFDVNNEEVFMALNRRLPDNTITNDLITHLTWMITNTNVLSSWNSVFHLLMSDAAQLSPNNPNPTSQFKKGLPLRLDLPATNPIQIMYRGIGKRQDILILEILGLVGINIPADRIIYSHPSLKERVYVKTDKRTRITNTKKDEDFILNDESVAAKENADQEVIDTSPGFFMYNEIPELIPIRRKRQEVSTGNEHLVTSGRGGKNIGSKEVSTEDSQYGSDTPPIEFSSLRSIPNERGIGLEKFFKMIQYLKENYPELKIKMSIIELHVGRKFSTYLDGARRTCAVVQITYNFITKYTIEIARADNWSISTLIIFTKKKIRASEMEVFLLALLHGVVNKSGHWDQNVLNQNDNLIIEKIKHYKSDSLKDWALRIVSKLGF